MSKAPAMPMYWDAYLADTTHLTTEEHGAYMLLLAAMWRRNAWVPDDDKDNARILGLTPAKWRRIKARLMETVSGFRVEDGKITQEKLQKTWKNTQEKIRKNRLNGVKGGRPKSSKNKDIAKANGSVSVNPNESIPEPEPEPYINTPLPPKGESAVKKKPDHNSDPAFQDWWQHYPKKVGKKAAYVAWKGEVRDIGIEKMLEAVRGFSKSWTARLRTDPSAKKYIPDPERWLRKGKYDEFLPASQQSTSASQSVVMDFYESLHPLAARRVGLVVEATRRDGEPIPKLASFSQSEVVTLLREAGENDLADRLEGFSGGGNVVPFDQRPPESGYKGVYRPAEGFR